ncbi:HlyD family secretion protein [Bosea sp. TAB14]|uniref:HlyD family secretion protein n=1 Tax=Bosea sp. TAB14 TaxID=3237481 RepID=UPI003F8E8C6C
MKLVTASLAGLAVSAGVFAVAATTVVPARLMASWTSNATDNAYVRGDLTPLSPKIAGYIVAVGISDNQAVKAGDILFRIDDADYRARVEQARATLDGRRAAVGNLDSRLDLQRSVIQQMTAALQGADAASDRLKRDLHRANDLSSQGWASKAREDQAQADSLQADAKVAEAKANLAAAQSQIRVLESQRPQLIADIEAGGAALRLAAIDLESTVIRSPADGWVGERQARIGQYVRAGTLLVAFIARDVWVVANFKETQLPGITPGALASIFIDGAPGVEFVGHIESLSPASGAQFALLPPDNATGNFTRIVQRIPVRVAFATGQSGMTALRPGMSAIVSLKGGAPASNSDVHAAANRESARSLDARHSRTNGSGGCCSP